MGEKEDGDGEEVGVEWVDGTGREQSSGGKDYAMAQTPGEVLWHPTKALRRKRERQFLTPKPAALCSVACLSCVEGMPAAAALFSSNLPTAI